MTLMLTLTLAEGLLLPTLTLTGFAADIDTDGVLLLPLTLTLTLIPQAVLW